VTIAVSGRTTDDIHQEVAMSPNSDTTAHGRIYYPGPGIVVTSVYIETPEARYPVRDLVIENPSGLFAHPARAAALFAGVVEFALAAVVATVLGSAAWLWVAGAVVALSVAGAVLADNRRNPRWMELTAWHQGRRVVLFASADQRVFGQVQRAVVRAREAHRPPRP
jgi:hypothetical protein